MKLQIVKTALVLLFLRIVPVPLRAEKAAEPIPVKVFVVAHDQKDHGTTNYAGAVRKQLAEMPRYKSWTGSAKAFPKNGILIDIQGIDILDKNDAVIGSAVIATISVKSQKEPGYSKVLMENLMEIQADDDDGADQATELLEAMDRRIPPTQSK
jgi:hypothetical protein